MPPQISAPRGGENRADRGTDVRHDLWAPTLVRAVVALVFAAVTMFWQEPSLEAGRWVMAVSYTHLDVYKRQRGPWGASTTGSACAGHGRRSPPWKSCWA